MNWNPDGCLGQGLVPLGHLSAPVPPSPSCGFTGLAPAVGGLSVDTPHGERYLPTGTEVTHGIPTVKPSKHTFRGLQF